MYRNKYHKVYYSKFGEKEIFRINRMSYHSNLYQPHLIITKDTKLFKILEIISVTNESWILIQPMDVIRHDSYCNSLVIQAIKQTKRNVQNRWRGTFTCK